MVQPKQESKENEEAKSVKNSPAKGIFDMILSHIHPHIVNQGRNDEKRNDKNGL